MLKVKIPNSAGNGTDYKLVDGMLSVNPGFTGTLTAEYEFTTSPTREIDFEYDHNGLRTRKKVVENGVTTTYDYTLHGKLITHLTKRTVDAGGNQTMEEMHFFYDAQSKPAMVEYNDTMYRYVHSLQGDIVGLLDSNGALVVEYKYDAWGKPLSVTGALADTLGKRNPFRYRGYVYDEETGLYYLRSRYYNPAHSRFLSLDDIDDETNGPLWHNLYCYCLNAPTIAIDSEGRFGLLALAVGSLFAVAVEALATSVLLAACVVLTVAVTTEVADLVTDVVPTKHQERVATKEEEVTVTKTIAKAETKVKEKRDERTIGLRSMLIKENTAYMFPRYRFPIPEPLHMFVPVEM